MNDEGEEKPHSDVGQHFQSIGSKDGRRSQAVDGMMTAGLCERINISAGRLCGGDLSRLRELMLPSCPPNQAYVHV